MKFKSIYYRYSDFNNNRLLILNNIRNKKRMSYEYFKKNKFNYFSDEQKKNAFINYVNKILSSNVIKEYFSKVKSFQNYEFPFEDKRIINYLWEKILFVDLDEYCWGITHREGFCIFINRNKGYDLSGIQLGAYAIAIIREFVGNYITNLINSNNKLKTNNIVSNNFFVDAKDNKLTKDYFDAGDKFEIMLFGQKVRKLWIGGNHFLFDIKNWDLSLEKFRKGFIENNALKKVNELLKELEYIRKDDFVDILFKNINYEYITDNAHSQILKIWVRNATGSQGIDMSGHR